MTNELLDLETVIPYLRGRGVLNGLATATALAGGVSNVVLAVHDADRSVVLKQSLERLRVDEEWLALQRRILSEAAAIRSVAGLTPDVAPALVDIDSDLMTLTMLRAPAGWRDWKTDLVDGRIDSTVGKQLGALLGAWHGATAGGTGLPSSLTSDTAAFEMLG